MIFKSEVMNIQAAGNDSAGTVNTTCNGDFAPIFLLYLSMLQLSGFKLSSPLSILIWIIYFSILKTSAKFDRTVQNFFITYSVRGVFRVWAEGAYLPFLHNSVPKNHRPVDRWVLGHIHNIKNQFWAVLGSRARTEKKLGDVYEQLFFLLKIL